VRRTRRATRAAATAIALAVAATSCHRKADPLPTVEGDAARGHARMIEFECSRCHDGADLPAAAPDKQCVQCHRDILAGAKPGPTVGIDARWRARVGAFDEAPSLQATGARLRRAWLVDFLQHPHDLRPQLTPTMPRLPLTGADARDIASYLVPTEDPTKERAEDAALLEGASLERGRRLLVNKACGACHAMTGVPEFAGAPFPPEVRIEDRARAVRLAPDLRYARDRMTATKLARWLREPKRIKPDTAMPPLALTADEARDLTAYLMTTPLAPLPARSVPQRLPDLLRPVTYDEVRDKIFQRTCWHCHSNSDRELGDTGPGNAGGFGFPPRRLDLSEYAGLFAGAVDDRGERHSVFSPMPDGTPRLIAALVARQREEAGDDSAPLRGMPLGLPALTPEEIQLVSTWIAQGRRR
jgi:cytochrome c2